MERLDLPAPGQASARVAGAIRFAHCNGEGNDIADWCCSQWSAGRRIDATGVNGATRSLR